MTTPAPPDLTGVHLKLDRADEHLKGLESEIMAFVGDPDYIRFETRRSVLDDSYSVIFHVSKTPPLRFGVILGDVCHNMRSALDHLVAALVPAGQVHNAHQFPIFSSQQAWQSEFGGRKARKMLDFVDPSHVALIESLQPYQPTGVAHLSLLQRFSNSDKHRLIHAAVANIIERPTIAAARMIPMPVAVVDYLPGGQPIRDGAEVARFRGNLFVRWRPLPDGSMDLPDSELSASYEFIAAMVFGERGNEHTRFKEFGDLLKDVRSIVQRFHSG